MTTSSPTDTNSAHPTLVGMLDLNAVTELLIKHYGIHEGKYDLVLQFNFAAGMVGPDGLPKLPGAVLGVSGIGIVASAGEGVAVIDAAKVNPKPKKK